MKTPDQQAVRTLVRARMDFQAMRKAMSNRLGKKADGSNQDLSDGRTWMADDMANFQDISDVAKKQEQTIEKMLKKTLKRFPVYNEYLAEVKGVGTIAAGWIIGEFDIHIATTVSKMWQYSGMNPGMVRGKKRIEPGEHKGEKLVSEVKDQKGKVIALIVESNEMIRGDRATKGFVLPYNKPLRTALVGVMADGFIKAQSPYCMEFYYPYKERLAQEETEVLHVGKMKQWKEVSPGHRDRAAKRYMVKMFLKDLYVAWREIEGLPVRCSYQEEYLNHKHAG
jgi:hypothetical protein